MQMVTPKVYFVAGPNIKIGLEDFLYDNGIEWKIPSNPYYALAEFAGRLCYESWKNTDNLNITKTREKGYIQNIIKQKHGSVFEHGNLVFLFNNVSRVFTHELVRHRAGSAFSQTSGRYVRLRNIKFWIPDCINDVPEAREIFIEHIHQCEEAQGRLEEIYDVDNLPFSKKKELTSAFRRLAPCGLANNILWSTNHRAVRNIIELRTAPGAEVEIRKLFKEVFSILLQHFPEIYEDAIIGPESQITFTHNKI